MIDEYFEETKKIIDKINKDQIEKIINLLLEARENGKTIYVMGNGGSASTASHFSADLTKFTIVDDKKRFKVISLVDNTSLISALTNDDGWGSVYEEQLKPMLDEGDILVGFSVHGGSGEDKTGPWSQNLVRAINLAKKRNAKIISFSGFDGGEMQKLSDICITIPINSEPLGTPLVESFHLLLHHLIVAELKERIKNE